MYIIKITGKPGSGKSEALRTIAESLGGTVTQSRTVMASIPMLQAQLAALPKNTFIDEVQPADLTKLERLAKLYPSDFRLYVAGESL